MNRDLEELEVDILCQKNQADEDLLITFFPINDYFRLPEPGNGVFLHKNRPPAGLMAPTNTKWL